MNSFSSTLRFDDKNRKRGRFILNTFLLTRSFNQVDLQNMMDQTREKRSHQSKFVKQLCYYTIVVTLQIRSVWSIFL